MGHHNIIVKYQGCQAVILSTMWPAAAQSVIRTSVTCSEYYLSSAAAGIISHLPYITNRRMAYVTREVTYPASTLEEVIQQFKTWRATPRRKSRIAAELWDAAVSLTDQYSIHRISRTLKLNHSALRDQVAARTHEKCLATAQQACFL
jgi:hypothetical protein